LSNESKNDLYFNNDSIITKKLSCIQYLLLKFGFKKSDWEKIGIETKWLGFEYIDNLIAKLNDETIKSELKKCDNIEYNRKSKVNNHDDTTIIMCLLYPLVKIESENIPSITQFRSIITK
jgi:hypothetical protein